MGKLAKISMIITSIVSDEPFKAVMFILGAIGAFLSPITSLLGFAGGLIAVDLFTGIWASRVRGEKFDSKKLRKSYAKCIIYPLGIIIGYTCEKFHPEIPFVKGASFLLIVIEGKSFEENASTILGYSLMKYIRTFVFKGRKGVIEMMNEKDQEKEQNDG